MKHLYWTGICHDERLRSIAAITSVVSSHATILNFQKFSDISLSLILETEECRLVELQQDLSALMSLGGAGDTQTGTGLSCRVFLNITFADGKGDLAIPVTDVPG